MSEQKEERTPNTGLRLAISYLVVVVATLFGLNGHYKAIVAERTILLKDDSLHTARATISGLRDVNTALKNCTWINTYRIDRIVQDVDCLAVKVDTLMKN